MGTLLGIAYKCETRGAMITCLAARVGMQTGVESDYRGSAGKRQVTVLSKSGFEAACAEVNQQLVWTIRRANLFIDGIDLVEKTGFFLCIGDLVLLITGETKPCFRMDEQCEGLKQALTPDWRGGVTCRVVREGVVTCGNRVILLETDPTKP